MSTVMQQAQQLIECKARRRRWQALGAVLAGAVATTAVWAATMMPASALETSTEPVCGMQEHTHTDACYTHELACGMAETTGHVHTDACYSWESQVGCGLDEWPSHVHGDACYTTQTYLACGQEEGEDHTHTDECYASETFLTCGQEETPGHMHTNACMVQVPVLTCGIEEGQAHTHTNECYPAVLACSIPEHQHSEQCYVVAPDLNADLEGPEQWEKPFEYLQLTGDWATDLVTVANTQVGYVPSDRNYVIDEQGIARPYTRYGQWFGLYDVARYADDPEQAPYHADPDVFRYIDWDAAFVAFALNYAGVSDESVPYETDPARWVQTLQAPEWNLYCPAGQGYEVKPGDLVFFDNDQDGVVDHVGIVTAVQDRYFDAEGNEVYAPSGPATSESPQEGLPASGEQASDPEEAVDDPAIEEAGEPTQPVFEYTYSERTLTVVCQSQTPSQKEVAETLAAQPDAQIPVTPLVKAEQLELFDPEAAAKVVGYAELPQNPQFQQPQEPSVDESPEPADEPTEGDEPDPAADVETAEDWEATLQGVDLTGNLRNDVVAVAQSQLGYTESARNYIVGDDGETRYGYTRYGAWYGDPYGDWCAMFASFCLSYGGATEYPLEASCPRWVVALQETGAYTAATDDYIPQPGDLVFFDRDGDGVADHVGIVSQISTESIEVPNPDFDPAADPNASDAEVAEKPLEPQDPTVELEGTEGADPAADGGVVGGEPVEGDVTDGAAQPADDVADGADPMADQAGDGAAANEPADADVPATITVQRLTGFQTIEGNSGDAVTSLAYGAEEPTLLGYGRLTDRTGFTINGLDVDPCFTWNYEDGLITMDVTLQGDATFDGEIPEGVEPKLDVEIATYEDLESFMAALGLEVPSNVNDPFASDEDQDHPAAEKPLDGEEAATGTDGSADNASGNNAVGESDVADESGAANGRDIASLPVISEVQTESQPQVVDDALGADGFNNDLEENAALGEDANEDDGNGAIVAEETILGDGAASGDNYADPGLVACDEETVEDLYPLMTFKLHLTVGDEEIDISNCAANTQLSMMRDIVALPAALSEDAGIEAEVDIAVKVYTQEGEVATADVDADDNDQGIELYYISHGGHVSGIGTVENANPSYTLQHYFWFPSVSTQKSGSEPTLNFINASSGAPNNIPTTVTNSDGLLPKNNGNNSPTPQGVFQVPLISDDALGGMRLKSVLDVNENGKGDLTKIFDDEVVTYADKPQISYMSRLYNDDTDYNSNYSLEAIWVYSGEKNIETLTESDFIKYNVPVNDANESLHNPSSIRFTNNPSNRNISKVENNIPIPNTDLEQYPYIYTILIEEGSVIRLVFNPTIEDNSQPISNVGFFDYDITDGNIYSNADFTSPQPTESQTNTQVWYGKTHEEGINNPANYKGTGAKYAFGNNNAGTGLGTVTWNSFNINMRNGKGIVGGTGGNALNDKAYRGCSFGLVSGLTYGENGRPIPIFSDGINAPDIFSANDDSSYIKGKTSYVDGEYDLSFNRHGGTYTLQFVNTSQGKAVTGNLRTFALTADQSYSYKEPVYSNSFWPLSEACPSWGTDGHDLKFGNNTLKDYRKYSSSGTFPTLDGDVDVDKNAYFGMSFTIDFTIQPGYASPLAYWFYGDDDMWVFLDELDEDGNPLKNGDGSSRARLVADIGGVHASVGEYVNLWDYIPHIDYTDANGNPNSGKSYRLTVFYTERGASGSSCFMRFTVPTKVNTKSSPERTEALIFEKVLLDENGDVAPYASDGEAFLFELTLTDGKDGPSFDNAYPYSVYQSPIYNDQGELVDGSPDHTTATPIEGPGVISNPAVEGEEAYRFVLHGGEYIVITELPDNTWYTIEEVGCVKPVDGDGNYIRPDGSYELDTSRQYVTYFQKGRHRHGADGGQINSLESSVYYGRIAGTPNINAAENNLIRFTNGPALKTEVTPGDGGEVAVGDEIIYEIDWGNDQSDTAEVVITDVLDNGLDFVAAGFEPYPVVESEYENKRGKTWQEWDSSKTAFVGGTSVFTSEKGNTIAFDPASKTLVWTRFKQSTQSSGTVWLKVRVTKDAVQKGEVENSAIIEVGDHPAITTNVTKNPVWEPVKTEEDPGAGKQLHLGEDVRYRISWKNYTNDRAIVRVKDPLDVGVTFDAEIDEQTKRLVNAKAFIYTDSNPKGTNGEELTNAVITYNSDPATIEVEGEFSGELLWDLGEQASGAEGYVEFIVKTNEKAVQATEIWNWGYVQVNNGPWVETNHIWNPLTNYRLPQTGGSGTQAIVLLGFFLLASALIGIVLKRLHIKYKIKSERRGTHDISA